MAAEKVSTPPVRWVVVVSVCDPRTGAQAISHQYECRDRHHARTLLTEVSELAAQLQPFLPGLSVDGYELGEAFSLTPQGQSALAALMTEAASGRTHNARWWAEAMKDI